MPPPPARVRNWSLNLSIFRARPPQADNKSFFNSDGTARQAAKLDIRRCQIGGLSPFIYTEIEKIHNMMSSDDFNDPTKKPKFDVTLRNIGAAVDAHSRFLFRVFDFYAIVGSAAAPPRPDDELPLPADAEPGPAPPPACIPPEDHDIPLQMNFRAFERLTRECGIVDESSKLCKSNDVAR